MHFRLINRDTCTEMKAACQSKSSRVAQIVIVCALLAPELALANPVIIEPSSLLAFGIVAFWALVVETGVVSLLLTFQGVNPLKIFMAYGVTNITIFVFIFEPLLNEEWAPVPILEAAVVLLDCIVIKVLTRLSALQGNDYKNVTWLRSLIVSCIGNAASYFVGNIASQKPWEH